MSHERIVYEKADGVATITLNRPEKLNAWDGKMLEEMQHAFREASSDRQVRVIVFTGRGRAFGVGADLAIFESIEDQVSFRALNRSVTDLFRSFELTEKPVLAAINGLCVGGGLELALSCDIRLASDQARFGFTEVNIGLIPGATGTARLPALIGPDKAKRLIFTAELIGAEEAERLGLVTEVVKDAELAERTRALAAKICEKAPLAVGMAKLVITKSLSMDLDSLISYEAMCQSLLVESQDHKEGLRAFREKRKPKFVGS